MKEINKFKGEFLKTMVQLATAGFGLVAALAWNSAIQALIQKFLPTETSGLVSQVVYALTVTFIAVMVTYALGKAVQREEARADKEEKKK